MKCPNCGNLIESFNCKECGFDLKKSRLLSAVKFDASEISSMNEYIRVEDERITKEEKRRSDKAKEEAERKRAEEREHYEQDDKRVLETFYQSYSKIFEKYSDANGYLVGLREAYNGKNLQDVYDECLSFYNGAYQRLASEVVGLADNAKEQLHSDKSKAEIDNQITSFMADRKRLKDLLEQSKTRVDAQRKAKEAAAFRDKVTEENRKQREQKEAEEREKAARKAEEERKREEEEARRAETDSNRERIIADDNRRRKEQSAKAENERRIRNKKRVLFFEILALCVVICVGVFVWKKLNKTSYGTKGIEITTPESINAFEKIGFYYDEEESEFDCPWPKELGGLINHIGMVMESDTGCSLCFSDDFTRLLYILPESSAGMNMGVLTISNGKEERAIDLGNGYNVPEIALKNAYIIAQMMADNPSNPFLRCFPEEVAKAIEENNSTVILLQGPASETGEFDNTGHVNWGFNIESNDYKYYNGEHDRGRKKICVAFYTGTNAESGLVGTAAEQVFGKKQCGMLTEIAELYESVSNAVSAEGNSFNPETMSIVLSDNAKEKLIELIPYVNVDTDENLEAESASNESRNHVDESWGPQDRETYLWDAPAEHVVFNSITDNPTLGDERNFVRVRKSGVENAESDIINVEIGEEYEVTIYFNNDADPALNEDGSGIAKSVYMRTAFPKAIDGGQTATVAGFISSSNAEPNEIWDCAYLKSEQPIYLEYVVNSATLHNTKDTNGVGMSGDALMSDQGVSIGLYDNMWGMVPAGSEFGGYLTYKIKISAVDEEYKDAWGPQDRDTFLWEDPAPYATFNSITNNPGIGSEMNFVRVKAVGDSNGHTDDVDIEKRKRVSNLCLLP